ncbi:alpha/beta hydrolase [Bythopirellula polymerisocia]|uniref:Acetylxylan esterase n=1 Tax=Bythopirellula polymerisocia TaxID=2528003 RepID=A0A5C6D025_9BACT|nr:alpha/beta hydrolase [Bythopirellula polymerisocia]TWU30252.1 Acetylxylan esterase precursor [Bythopirellula polymerisocia]
MKQLFFRSICLIPVLLFLMSTQVAHSQQVASQQVIDLWNGDAPGSEDFTDIETSEERGEPGVPNSWVTQVKQPTLTLFPASSEKNSKTAVIVCPGGGYGGLAFDKEGNEVAQWFADRGVTAFVLKYRHGGGPHQHPVPLSDVQRAMRIVRSSANVLGYQPDRIGVMGFSAGGHLASSIGTHFDSGDESAEDTIDRKSCRPDFLILIYPVISMDSEITHGGSRNNLLGDQPADKVVELMSNELQVTDDTPPTFLVHATDDGAVPVENSLRFYRALVDHKVPAELHVFDEGGHGFGMRQKEKPVGEWPHLLENWLGSRGLIVDQGR